MKLNESIWYIGGIVSLGPKDCGKEDKPGVYTRASEYLDWIQSKIRP